MSAWLLVFDDDANAMSASNGSTAMNSNDSPGSESVPVTNQLGLMLEKFVVFQMPPLTEAAYAMSGFCQLIATELKAPASRSPLGFVALTVGAVVASTA